MIYLNGHEIKPTIFPDKTSQVWKIPQDALKSRRNMIEWEFESEAELIHVLQLAHLVSQTAKPSLLIPFLPYGRQDKPVSNETTFALRTLILTLENSGLFRHFLTWDAHSMDCMSDKWSSIIPDKQIADAIKATLATTLCFPDKGAAKRYSHLFEGGFEEIIMDKVRNQSTGVIEGLKIVEGPNKLDNKRILIIDDICDGGRTFIEAANVLYSLSAKEVNLYTTHGIYSKGIEVLREANIKRIFNLNGEVK